jgi:hypothetical protein
MHTSVRCPARQVFTAVVDACEATSTMPKVAVTAALLATKEALQEDSDNEHMAITIGVAAGTRLCQDYFVSTRMPGG